MVFHIPANICLIFAAIALSLEIALTLLFTEVRWRRWMLAEVLTYSGYAGGNCRRGELYRSTRSLAVASSPALAGLIRGWAVECTLNCLWNFEDCL
jgi:hypothetical protein